MRKGSSIFLAFLFALTIGLFGSAVALADDPLPQEGFRNNAADLPAVGTLLVAAFESAGYQGQANILSQLSELLKSLGALIYVGVLLSAIATVALMGNYRTALWLLVGPPMFFFFIAPTNGTPAGVEWRFGAFEDQGGEDLRRITASAEDTHVTGPVAWAFHEFNLLISDVYQYLIGVITSNDIKSQMKFMARQRVMDDLMEIRADSPGLVALAGFTFAHCGTELGSARMIAMGNRDGQPRYGPSFREDPSYQGAIANYCENWGKPNKSFPPGPWQTYVTENFELPPNATYTREEFLQQLRDNSMSVSCSQLWFWLVRGAVTEVRTYLREALNRDLDPNVHRYFPGVATEVIQEVEREITRREDMDGTVRQPRVTQDPCPDPLNTAAEASNLERIFAGYLIRKVLLEDPRGEMIDQIYDGGGIRLDQAGFRNMTDPATADAIGRRYRAHELAESQKYEAFFVAMTIPYIQGILLYALAVTYPFFALMLILPGQAGAFFAWMALWAWVKSWDVGWAMVMVVDDILWELLPHSSYYEMTTQNGGNVVANGAFDTPVTLLEGAFHGDHSYTLSTYWVLLSLMMTGVPLLTAQAIMGTKKAMAGILLDGIRGIGEKLGGYAADWTAVQNLFDVERHRKDAMVTRGMAQLNTLISRMQSTGQLDSMERQSGHRRGEMGTLGDRLAANLARGSSQMQLAGRQLSNAFSSPAEAAGTIADLADQAATGIQNTLGQIGNDINAAGWAMRQAITGEQGVAARPFTENAQPQSHRPPREEDAATTALRGEIAHYDRLENEIAQRGRIVNLAWNNFEHTVLGAPERVIESRNPDAIPGAGAIDANGLPIGTGSGGPLDRSMDDTLGREQFQELNRYRQEIEKLQRRATFWQGVGELELIGGTALAGLFQAPALFFGAVATGGHSFSSYNTGIELERLANQHRANFVTEQMKLTMFQNFQTREWYFYEQLRAYVTLRGEWWNVPQIPSHIPSKVDEFMQRMQVESNRLEGESLGSAIWHAKEAVVMGRGMR